MEDSYHRAFLFILQLLSKAATDPMIQRQLEQHTNILIAVKAIEAVLPIVAETVVVADAKLLPEVKKPLPK